MRERADPAPQARNCSLREWAAILLPRIGESVCITGEMLDIIHHARVKPAAKVGRVALTATKTINFVGRTVERVRRIDLDPRERIHFLHLGKNAGTEVARYIDAINRESKDFKIVKHGHDAFLRQIPRADRYFFSIRNPIARFRSGFYSRKRKGQPRFYSEWSAYDHVAFQDFEHANDLAESLFRNDDLGRKAFAAVKSIRHTAQNQVDWFYGCGNLFTVRPPIAVIRKEHFDRDISLFQSLIGLIHPIALQADKIASHMTDYGSAPGLSDKAVANLRRWYAQDFVFYDLCSDWMEMLHKTRAVA
jgi:hypothetical protein